MHTPTIASSRRHLHNTHKQTQTNTIEQTESETYAKNAYGAPKGVVPAEKDKEGDGQEQRKLGGYRLVQFKLVPFEDVYFQHTADVTRSAEKEEEVCVRTSSSTAGAAKE